MRNPKASVAISLLVILGTSAAILLSLGSGLPRLDSRVHQDIGRALAQEAVKLMGSGGQLKVITRDTVAFPQPALDLAVAGFRQELQLRGVAVAAIQSIQVDPLRPVEVPAGDFFQLLRRGASGDVVVSFLGPPLLTEQQRNDLGDVKSKTVAFCSGDLPEFVNLRGLAENKLLHAAVISRRVPTALKGRPSFEDLYFRAGTKELLNLPEPTGPRSASL